MMYCSGKTVKSVSGQTRKDQSTQGAAATKAHTYSDSNMSKLASFYSLTIRKKKGNFLLFK